MSYKDQIDKIRLPQHVAIIMDGNGRWAKERKKDRSYGHQYGAEKVREVTEAAAEIGLKYLTVYAFSTENWNRPDEEVTALMALMIYYIEKETPDLIKNNVRLTAIGDLSRIPEDARKRLEQCMDDTSVCTGLTLVLALSYSSRWEISRAVKNIASDVKDNKLKAEDIDDKVIDRYLMTADMPDPDLLIRTGGETRISNFLLWQLSYAELYFTPEYWPDFGKENLYKAIVDYQSRERRFGKTSEQL
ncbi:isoprenyl transferase [Coprobacter tertius]|uniref:Isoprenyl transferase n=1 Tax=Coprobacter tertius TaxID=2944915 RepID=A0ABT1MKC7_9BACT|nr:isoprenyl transferase [Coprobacter tertius]MCP9613072.1 isoprenyl transferase [Coprobacter tertius]